MICQVCEKRPAQGYYCDWCLRRVTRWLAEIPELYLELQARHQADPTPSRHDGSQVGVRVGGTRERSVPIDLDTVDLLLRKEHSEYCKGISSTDDLGATPVLSMLDTWVRVLRSRWYANESLPTREVPTLALWLSYRLERVAEVDQDTPALTDALRRTVWDLRRVLEGVEPKPERRYGRCAKCRLRALNWVPDWEFVKCGACGHTMTDDEYARYLRETMTLKPRKLGIHAENVTESDAIVDA